MSAIHDFLYGRPTATPTIQPVPRAKVVATGRVLMSVIFVMSGVAKLLDWGGTAAYMTSAGLPSVDVLLVIAAAAEILGGLSLLTGTFARAGALGLFVFLVATTLVFHDFWNLTGAEQTAQMIQFMKNLAIMGGLLHVVGYGAGRLSLDARLKERFD